ncbi:MAG TPA: hypothetical protein VMF08_01910 [Candidatus Sulfotelmatobacter sp.]|nr:hypothetical protein [Candidatus Sulfotelmatobacter sp.]
MKREHVASGGRAALPRRLCSRAIQRPIALVFVLGFLLSSCATLTPPPKVTSSGGVTLTDFKLTGDLTGGIAAFTLTANATVADGKGGSLELLSGPVALTGLDPRRKWTMNFDKDHFIAVFDRAGTFPIEVHFNAAIAQSNDWSAVNFRVAPGVVQPVVLHGLAADTEFQFADAARPSRSGADFISYLPVDGSFNFAWRTARPEQEGKLFYTVDMISQISVGPGLMRQNALLDGKIMQGEMNRLVLRLRGPGDVTSVQGDGVLSWTNSVPDENGDREVVVQFNQPQRDTFAVLVQMQTSIGAFPQSVDAVRLQPEGATRFAGAFRIQNAGAVRLEVTQASGLSQISPDQFPQVDSSLFNPSGSQFFAYRFSSAEFALRINADQIVPAVGVSEVLAYNLGQNELSVDADIELDIRDAPLRELRLNIPKDYAIAQLDASGLSDYFTGNAPDSSGTQLRLVYGEPVFGRQVVHLELERNQPLNETNWILPRIEVVKANSVRGFVGVSADNGFRVSPEITWSLTEIAPAFFPNQLPGIQTAFRLSDPDWRATMRVERLPQTVQADVFHLFSIGQGIAYGSSVINYVVSGSPVSEFHLGLPADYLNVEFTGDGIRSWEKTTNGYTVQLLTPVSGAYTLLATYEQPFQQQGQTLSFTGARASDAQSESGHTIIISAYPFQVKPVDVSSSLTELEPGEVPPEYRLFFDQPVLKAYSYSSQPFNLNLELSPLAPGDSLAQVVDRAALTTHISKEGQAVTDARYFVKSRGNPNFSVTLPPGTELWSVSVNDKPAVPVTDQNSILIPLPQHTDPDAVLALDLQVAATSSIPGHVSLTAPVMAAPVMLANWQIVPDQGQRLEYESGTLTPTNQALDNSGFAQVAQAFHIHHGEILTNGCLALLFFAMAIILWRWASMYDGRRFTPRHSIGIIAGSAAILIATISAVRLANTFEPITNESTNGLTFLAPVQQAGSALTVEVANTSENARTFGFAGSLILVILAAVCWLYGWAAKKSQSSSSSSSIPQVLAWTVLAWAALRLPNGAPAFVAVIAAFFLVCILIPSARQLWRLSAKTDFAPPSAAVPPAAALLAALCLLGGAMNLRAAAALPESVTQQINISNDTATATASIHWQAQKGDVLPLLFQPAVLTGVKYPNSISLEPATQGSPNAQQLVAESSGNFDVEVQYQLQLAKGNSGTDNGADNVLALPVPSGLVNRATLTLANLNVDVFSLQAASVQCSMSGSNTVATLVLAPGQAWIGWRPRSRDVRDEKPVFYADFAHLYIPSAGVVQGVHQVSIRPAQGELEQLVFDVPAGATITDVDPGSDSQPLDQPSIVSLWRFDPDTRKLRVTLSPPMSRPFSLFIFSQVATGTLPFQQSVGLISVEGAQEQSGSLGVATGNDVQLDDAVVENCPAINLDDFPAGTLQPFAAQFPGLTVRRAFHYSDTQATALLKASAVEPDVRVVTQDTVSLGEDRTVLASTADVTIRRAGIFKLSFIMPPGFDVESISGAALSQWTELKTDAGRVITLNLTGKTGGEQQFILSLSGPGVKQTNAWTVPQVTFLEADKQSGTLLVVPEQGMRLETTASTNVMQLDPQKAGIAQKGVLAFNLLEAPWNLALNIEQVDPWVQVTSLQHVTIGEAQQKVVANLQYQIENAGLKGFRVFIPANAEGVTFQGDQLSDFQAADNVTTNGLQAWDIKLSRRVIGQYLLQASYQVHVPEQSTETALRGVLAADVNSQRGFVTVESAGRLEVGVDNLPASLQPTEWQAIPRALQKDMPPAAANFAYSLVEPDFELPLKLQRHEAAKLLPARVNDVTFTSVISDAGVMLTQARLDILPGDMRLLHLTLPPDAHYWFAFVDQNGVWPWREDDQILIPLDQSSRGDQPVPVEIYFSSSVGKPDGRALDLSLLAPKFDLPLQNLTWQVYLSRKWQVKKWSGTLQFQQQQIVDNGETFDIQDYLQTQTNWEQEKTSEAERMLELGNSALQNGDPQQARRAFESAYGLSTHDEAFNEDARVELNNLKLQQALMGLNARQAAVAGANGVIGEELKQLRNNRDANYTQQDAQRVIDNNSADENAAFMELAQRLIQQQEAAAANPAVIRASIPEQGRLLTFKRSVVVDTWADLGIRLQARIAGAISWTARLLILAITALALCTLTLLAARLAKT